MVCIVKVDVHRRRPLYHVVYGDGDEEDYDEGEFQYARELFDAHSRGEILPATAHEKQGTRCMLYLSFIFCLTFILVALQSETVRRMKPAAMAHQTVKVIVLWQIMLVGRSYNAVQLKKGRRKKNKSAVVKPSVKKGKMTAQKKGKQEVNSGGKTTFSIESVLDSFKESTEYGTKIESVYGTAFRSMDVEAQKLEVVRLNKGAATGMKGAIRKQRIDVQFKSLVSEKLKAHLIANRTEQKNMFRTVTHPRTLQKLQLKFLSVGEWVEVDADRTPGWNLEGGIAVIVGVNDGLADVK
jgi:hypothetical protein